jgi:hypothetical protein
MCSGKRRGRAALRANVTKTAKMQDEVYEDYRASDLRDKPRAKRRAGTKPHLHPGWKVYLAKPKRKRRAPEAAFQCQVAQYLSKALPEGYWFTAFPSGGGGRIRGAHLKRMGLKAGVPDLVVFKKPWGMATDVTVSSAPREHELYYTNWPVLWLELKAKAGSLSQAQRDVHKKLKNLGHRVETVKTLEQVETALAEFCFPEVLKARVSA